MREYDHLCSHHAQEETDAMLSRVDGMKEAVDESILGYEVLQDGVQRDKAATEDLLARGKAAQQVLRESFSPKIIMID